MKNEQKKSDNHNRIYIIIIAVVLCTAFYSFLRSCGNIHDNGAGVDNVRSGIKQSVQSNRELQDGIGNATETVDRLADVLNRSETTVDAAKGTAESLDSNLETAADAITKCKRIVDRIKQRNEERTPEP